jgi:hypothetical protein
MANIIVARRGTERKSIPSPGRKVPQIVRPRRPGGPLTTRGPLGRGKKIEQTDGPGDMAPNLGALITLPEWYVYWYLQYRKRMIPNLDFTFQSSLEGGRMELGGLVLDFELPGRIGSKGLVINVQGEVWHRHTTAQRGKDLNDKIRLTGMGYHVVYCNEDDILRSVGWVVDLALVGQQRFADTEFG